MLEIRLSRPNRSPRLPWQCLVTIGLLVAAGCQQAELPPPPEGSSLWAMAEAGYQPRTAGEEEEQQPRFPVVINKPSGPPVIELHQPDPQGRVGVLACSTCHSVREPNRNVRSASDLTHFHQQMEVAHGTLACLACHNPRDYDTLRLADETTIEYPEVMQLCAQCHGPQATAYKHGAHGGMTGYWDLTRGPRMRNNCIDCHDPHVPKFPRMVPTFKPRDRFLQPDHPAAEDSHE